MDTLDDPLAGSEVIFAFKAACVEQGGSFDGYVFNYESQEWAYAATPDDWVCKFEGKCSDEELGRGCEPSNMRYDQQYKMEYVPVGYCECWDSPWLLALNGDKTPEEVLNGDG